MKIKAVIVEDELLGQVALKSILKNYCSESVEILDIAADVSSAIRVLKANKPDLVFFDIKLGSNENGAFDILNAFKKIDFQAVFTTSSKQADDILRALNNFGAKKYLLKPLDIDEVYNAVEYIKEQISLNNMQKEIDKVNILIKEMNSMKKNIRLPISIKNGTEIVHIEDIIMMRSSQNCTIFFLTDKRSLKSSKNLKYYESQLGNAPLVRVSKSYIVNVNHVERHSNLDGGTIDLSENCTAALSPKYKSDFFKLL